MAYLSWFDALEISIHALREEGDEAKNQRIRDVQFLSTPSARRATRRIRTIHRSKCISIHALREEGDWTH